MLGPLNSSNDINKQAMLESDISIVTVESKPEPTVIKHSKPGIMLLKKPALFMFIIALCAFMFAFGYWTGLNSWKEDHRIVES